MAVNPLDDILKNAQKIQEQMGAFQKKMQNIEVTGSSGGGMVEVDMSGQFEVQAVRISPEAMEDRELLEDLLRSAFTAASTKAREQISQGMGSLPGLNLPDLMKNLTGNNL
jgi:DNA-binding YbaB/EbfC family protein